MTPLKRNKRNLPNFDVLVKFQEEKKSNPFRIDSISNSDKQRSTSNTNLLFVNVF